MPGNNPTINLYIYHDGSRSILNVEKYINPFTNTVGNHSQMNEKFFTQTFTPTTWTAATQYIANGCYITNYWTNVSNAYNDGSDWSGSTLSGYSYYLGRFKQFDVGTEYNWWMVVKVNVNGRQAYPNPPDFNFSNDSWTFVEAGILEEQDAPETYGDNQA